VLSDGLKYQESRMATEQEFAEDLLAWEIDRTGNLSKGGPVLLRQGNTVFSDVSDLHNLTVGDTGSMKTLRFVLPLLYSCGLSGESMIVVDPKGELVRKTSGFLQDQGYHISVLNWRSPQDSTDKWNPFGRVQVAYAKGPEGLDESSNLLNDILDKMFYKRSHADKDVFWNESAGRLALGICKLILSVDEALSMKTLLDWRYGKLKDGSLKQIFDVLPTDHEIYQNLSGYMNLTAENTKSCIESTFDQLTGIFSASSALTNMMSETTFDLESIGTQKTAVFLVVPDEKTTLHFLATLFISQCYETLLDKAEFFGGTLPIRVNFILEEFCNMPKLNDLVSMLTAARSRNIRFHLVIQAYSQMVDKYGENVSRTVLDNCGNLIYLHTREISFLEYVSKLAGNNEYGRPLLSASRLQHLKKNETVIFHDRCYPFVVQDIPLIFEYPIKLGTELPVARKPILLDPPVEGKKKRKKAV